MLLTLTKSPTAREKEFFHTFLTQQDTLTLQGSSNYLALAANEYAAKGILRKTEADKLGSAVHSDWSIISDNEWVKLALSSNKNVEW